MSPTIASNIGRQTAPTSPQTVLCRDDTARSYLILARKAAKAHDISTATTMYQAAITAWSLAKPEDNNHQERLPRRPALRNPREDYFDTASQTAYEFANFLFDNRLDSAGIEALETCIAHARRSNQLAPSTLPRYYEELGERLATNDYSDRAIQAFREAVAIRRADPPYSSVTLCHNLCQIALLQTDISSDAGNSHISQEILDEIDKCHPFETLSLLEALHPDIHSLITFGKIPIAKSITERLERLREEIGREADDYLVSLAELKSKCLLAEGNDEEALRTHRQALTWMEEKYGKDHSNTMDVREDFAGLCSACGKPFLAERLLTENLKIVQANKDQFPPEYELNLLLGLAEICIESKKLSEAEKHLQSAEPLISDYHSLPWARFLLISAHLNKFSPEPNSCKIESLLLEARRVLEGVPPTPTKAQALQNILHEQITHYCETRKFKIATKICDELDLLAINSSYKFAGDEVFLLRTSITQARGKLARAYPAILRKLETLPDDCPQYIRAAYSHYAGAAALERGDPTTAIGHLERARAILATHYDHPQPNLLSILQSLYKAYDSIGDTQNAERCEQAFENTLGQLGLQNDGEFFVGKRW